MTVRTAIVGLSWIGADPAADASDPVLGTAVPVSHAAAMAVTPEIEVVGACDIVPAARDRFVERWADRWPDSRVYADYREMLAETKPDLVSVVTPDHLHTDIVMAAIEAGAKGIYCEKPLATSLEEATAIVRAVREAGVAMNVEYTRRWLPEYVEARRLARSGALGELSQIIVQVGGPRAMLWRNLTHVIDMLCYLSDGTPEWVSGELEAGFEDYGTEYAGDGGADPATEPGANFYVAFDNGVRAYVTGMKRAIPGEGIYSLMGDRATLIIDHEGMRMVSYESENIRTTPGVTRVQSVKPTWTVSGVQAGLLDLLATMRGEQEPASPPEAAWMTVAITQAVLLSQSRGNVPVRIADLDHSLPPSTET